MILRSVLIILSPYIKIIIDGTYNRINQIISRAINPISIYLLAKYFHAKNDLLEEYIEENNLEYDKLTFEEVKDFYDNVDPMDFEDEKMAEKYMKNNENFGNPILLTIDVNELDNIKQAKKIFKNTILKCPEKVGGKKRTKNMRKRTKTNKNKTNKNKTNRSKTNRSKTTNKRKNRSNNKNKNKSKRR